MKKLVVALITVSYMGLISACATGCKIDGCRNEIYKNGLCEEHYTMIEKASEQTTVAEESLEESKTEESTIQQEEESVLNSIDESETISEVVERTYPSDFILPESAVRVYSREELSALSKEELRLARNEIYARYGRIFSSDDLKTYFSDKSWYTPRYSAEEFDAKGDSIFNQFERENLNLIIAIEKNEPNFSIENSTKQDYIGKFYVDFSRYYSAKPGEFYGSIKISDISNGKIYGTLKIIYGEGDCKSAFPNGVELNDNGMFYVQGVAEGGSDENGETFLEIYEYLYQLSYKNGKPVIYELDKKTKERIECYDKVD